jgi:uncharacterized protein YceK
MMPRSVVMIAAITGLSMAGCGTMANLAAPGPAAGGKAAFGGVQRDLDLIRTAHGESDTPQAESHPTLKAVAATVDLPFSFVGDVVTWPYVAAYSIVNRPSPTPPVVQIPTPPANAAERPTIVPNPFATPQTNSPAPGPTGS